MNEPTAHVTPAVRIVATNNDDIDRHSQVAQSAVETHRLLCLICDLGLYNEKVDIAMPICCATSMRAKQNDLRIACGSSKTPSHLHDQSLINCSHD